MRMPEIGIIHAADLVYGKEGGLPQSRTTNAEFDPIVFSFLFQNAGAGRRHFKEPLTTVR